MQMQLPIFPENTRYINSCLGFFKKDSIIYFLHNGSPISCFQETDLQSYRYICGTLVVSGLCTNSELAKALGVNKKNIERYSKAYREKGSSWFLNRTERRGECYKLKSKELSTAQELLNNNVPISQIANKLGVTEGAIRYHIKKETLKKN